MSAIPGFCPSSAKNSHVRFSHLGCPIMTCRVLWHIRKCPLILLFCLALLGNDALPRKRSDLFVMLVGRSRKQQKTSDLPFEQLTPNNLRRFQTSYCMRSINSLKNIRYTGNIECLYKYQLVKTMGFNKFHPKSRPKELARKMAERASVMPSPQLTNDSTGMLKGNTLGNL